jgi:predicted ATPase/DNA-binding SARP family transcriptional activator
MEHVSISMFGGFSVAADGQPLNSFRYQKVRALLAYLAAQPEQEHPRSLLVGLLWPELPNQTALANLRQALNHLRRALHDRQAGTPFLLVQRDHIRWNSLAPASIDAVRFTALLEVARQHPHRSPLRCQECQQRLQEALALYQGPFLADFFLPDSASFEEWVILTREAYQRQALQAMAALARIFEELGQYDQALHYAYRQLEIDPWREEIHRQVMHLLALSGQRGAALAQYESCRRVLAQEFGLEPEPETQRLYEQIRTLASGAGTAATQGAPNQVSPKALPAPVTPFVGRQKELARIASLCAGPDCRLITIIGAGGMGKTRLALQAAAQQQAAFAAGACFVPLAGISSANILASTIAQQLQIPLAAEVDVKQQLLEYLSEKDLLLVLDNFEHLLNGAGLVAEILEHCPGVVVLVTSRERLRLYGEWVFELEGLALPPEHSLEEAQESEAVRLFLQGARRANASASLDQAGSQHIARICRLLDGVPLAIELASAWTRSLSPAQIAREIEKNLAFLDGSVRALPEGGQSLQAIFDHSWRLMSALEQEVFKKAAVFRGGFSRAAFEAVAGGDLLLIGALLDKSLLARRPNERYELHEITRQYALQRLDAAGELPAACSRHLGYFLQLGETAQPELEGQQAAAWFDVLEDETDNLRAALAWSIESGDIHSGMRLAVSLYRFWYWRSRFPEGSYWYDALLEATRPLAPAVPPELLAKALHACGVLYNEMGALEQAQQRFQESLALRRQTGDKPGQAACLNSLGAIAFDRQDYPAAEALFEESLALRRQIGQRASLHIPLNNLGLLAQARRDYARARGLLEECLELLRETDHSASIAHSLADLGWVVLSQGDLDYAAALFKEALDLFQEVGDLDGLCYVLEGMAGVSAQAAPGHSKRKAARCFGAAHALRESISSPLSLPEQAEYEPHLEHIRSVLGEETFEQAWCEGRQTISGQPIESAVAALLVGDP